MPWCYVCSVPISDLRPAGIFFYEFVDSRIARHVMEIHIFIAEYSGPVQESDEIRPQWFRYDSMPFSDMWADNSYWIPKLLEEAFRSGEAFVPKPSVRYFLYDSLKRVSKVMEIKLDCWPHLIHTKTHVICALVYIIWLIKKAKFIEKEREYLTWIFYIHRFNQTWMSLRCQVLPAESTTFPRLWAPARSGALSQISWSEQWHSKGKATRLRRRRGSRQGADGGDQETDSNPSSFKAIQFGSGF